MSTDTSLDSLSIAVAHWNVRAWGGAEYLVTKLAEAVDTTTVYTLGEPEPDGQNPYGDVTWVDVATGPGRRLKRRFGRAGEYALWEDVDWREYGDPDILLTSGATTRAVITPDDTLHVNYCHSPPRWLYDLYHDRKESAMGQLVRPLVRYLRLRDSSIDTRVDRYFSNSPIVARRLWKFYKRDSVVLSPPLAMDAYGDDGDDGFYLHLGRLDDEKGVPKVVSAFTGMDRRIKFAGGRGDVSDDVVEAIVDAPNMEYLGFVDEAKKYELLATCRAVVFNGVNEDFGIVPIEANASGKPVLVPNSGFPRVYVDEPKNGYIHDGTPGGIRDSVDRLEATTTDADIQSFAAPYSMNAFERSLHSTLEQWYDEFESRANPRTAQLQNNV